MLVGKRHEQVTLELWYQTGEDEMKVELRRKLDAVLDGLIADIRYSEEEVFPSEEEAFKQRVREALCEFIQLNYDTVANLVEMLEANRKRELAAEMQKERIHLRVESAR